jgi:hypothetical protein
LAGFAAARSNSADRCDALARHDGSGVSAHSDALWPGAVLVVVLVEVDVVVAGGSVVLDAGTVVVVGGSVVLVVGIDVVVTVLVVVLVGAAVDEDVDVLLVLDDAAVVDVEVVLDVEVLVLGFDVLVLDVVDTVVLDEEEELVDDVLVLDDDVATVDVVLDDDVATVDVVLVDGATVVDVELVLGDDVGGADEEVLDELLLELVDVLLDVELDVLELVVVLVLVVVARHAPVFTSSRHWLSVPPSASASSEMVSVQTPFGFSPTNAASASSGTRFGAGPLGPQLRSVGSPPFAVYGTCPPGFAPSFQSVPLKALFTPGALSVVSVTIVPCGDVSVMSRSSL